MMSNFDARLTEIKTNIRSKQKLESMLRQARTATQEERTRCKTLEERLASEKADVDKLEGVSLTALFCTVLGTKEERVEKERQEFLAAQLKHEEATKALASSQEEVQRIEEQLAQYASADADYDELLKEKAALVSEAGDSRAETLFGFSEKLADLESDKKELHEAIQAGQSALKYLRNVSSELSSAANWGTFDLLGGGMLSTMAKHSKIDSAKKSAQHAQRQLRRFQEELADADQRLQLSLDIGGFSKFADFFFDGLIADWVVQSKIKQASSACSRTTSQVSSAVNACQRRLTETKQEIEKVGEQRREFVEQA